MSTRELFDPPARRWSLLYREAKSTIAALLEQWNNLLLKKSKEEVYHRFLFDYAGLFLVRNHAIESMVGSKLRLGSDYVIDFVKTWDHFSAGIQYEFIEIETPWAPPYTKKGNPSARLVEAVQQIDNWRLWIKENRYEFHRLFPFYHGGLSPSERLKFTVIIGTRENSRQWIEKRNGFAEHHGISIRSFDSLAENLRMHDFSDAVMPHLMGGWCSFEHSIELANPFFKAFSDEQWRAIVFSYKKGGGRIRLEELILQYREYNRLAIEFDKIRNQIERKLDQGRNVSKKPKKL